MTGGLHAPVADVRIRKRRALCLVCGNKCCTGFCELLGETEGAGRLRDAKFGQREKDERRKSSKNRSRRLTTSSILLSDQS